LLGRGGMGEVYAATDEESGLIVAIKVLRSDANGDAISRFDRECRILARFNHPHIARLLGHGVTEDHLPYLVMEYVEGQPILDYCESHGLELRARLKL
jgi:serine/threonine-protein kinase